MLEQQQGQKQRSCQLLGHMVRNEGMSGLKGLGLCRAHVQGHVP